MSSKPRKKRVVKVIRHNFEGGVEQLLDRLKSFGEAWEKKQNELVAKHNELAKAIQEVQAGQQKIAVFAAQEVGKLLAQQQVLARELGKSIDHLDLNVLASAEILKEIFGQLTQIDTLFNKWQAESGKTIEVAEADIEVIKKQAEDWFKDVTASAFRTIQQRREEEEKARLEAEQKAKEEAEKAAKDKAEAEAVEQEMLKGEAGVQQVGAGGPGSEIPDGAEVFGG